MEALAQAGAPFEDGAASYDRASNSWKTQAAGSGIGGTADAFIVVAREYSGDGEIVAETDPGRGAWDWSEVESRAGALMEKQDPHPERVGVRSFPSDQKSS
jgi:hypothetical protein